MTDDIYTLKRYKKKPKKSKFNKILFLIILILLTMIVFKSNNKIKETFYKYVFESNISFSKINEIYQKHFGTLIPTEIKEKEVFVEHLEYQDVSKYKEGVKLSVNNNYVVPSQESGIVVYIGEKEGYGNTVIIQQVNGIDLWYGNINNVSVKIYDYVEKGEVIGDTLNNDLYLVYKKEGKTLNYEEYIKG